MIHPSGNSSTANDRPIPDVAPVINIRWKIKCNLDAPHDDVIKSLRPKNGETTDGPAEPVFTFTTGGDTLYNSARKQLDTHYATDQFIIQNEQQVYENLNDSDDLTVETLKDLAIENQGVNERVKTYINKINDRVNKI